MRKLLIFLAIFALLAGMAGAQWYPRSENYSTTGDVLADNGIFTGDLTVTGLGSFTGGTVNSGVYDGDFRFAANHSLYSTLGSGGIDWSNATGTWKMPTGTGTIGGILDINGATTARNITLDANYNIVTSGTGTITSASTITGEQLTSTDDLNVTDDIFAEDLITDNTVQSGLIAASGDLTAGDDALITDDIVVDGAARIDETATVNALVSNTTINAAVDGILANSVIVPTYETIVVPISASSVDEYVFVADDAWWLVKAEEVHSVAGTEVAPIAANLTIRICDDAEAVTGGVNSTISVIPLNDAANTINTASLNSAAAVLADGDMIAFDYAGTLTGLRGSVTLTLRRM